MEAPSGTIAVTNFQKSRITFEKELGSGTFGKVFKATIKDWKGPVAIKVFYQDFVGILPNVDSKLRENALDELAKVAVMDHENIVRLLGMVQDKIPSLVFEYMKDGNLLEYVLRRKAPTEKSLLSFCRDICRGMSFLHKNNFLHKDLAARNILLDGKVAKIADLGLCSFLTEDHHGAYALSGKLFPYRHAASECIVENIFTYESDVWSFGVLMFEIFTNGAVPYGKENKQPEIRRFIADGKNPTHFYPPLCSEEVLIIIRSIFRHNRRERPTFDQLYSEFDSLLTSGKGMFKKLFSNNKSSSLSRATPQQLSSESYNSSTDKLYQTNQYGQTSALQIPVQTLRNRNHFASNPDIRIGNLQSSSQSGSPPSGTEKIHRSNRILTLRKENQGRRSPNTLSVDRATARRNSDVTSVSTSDSGISSSPTKNIHLGTTQLKPHRKTASYNNLTRQDNFYQTSSEEDILKDFVPNRFKSKH